MAEDKGKGALPKVEIIIVGVLLTLFMIWAVSQCSDTREAYQQRAMEEAEEQALIDSIERARFMDSNTPLDTSIKRLKQPEPEVPGGERVTTLYVVTPALNMRRGPGLRFGLVERLSLHDELSFLGEVTDSTERINLGDIVTDKPWVKVRSAAGKEGWVYGACVDYYKYELKGVEVD